MRSSEYSANRQKDGSLPVAADEIRDYVNALGDSSRDVRWPAIEALLAIGAGAIPALTEALDHSSAAVRANAVSILGQIGDARCVPAIIERLKDTDGEVCYTAIEALYYVGAGAVPATMAALKDDDDNVRICAAEALRRIGDARAAPALMEALNDRNSSIRETAAQALGSIGVRAVSVLAKAIKQSDDEACSVAIENSGKDWRCRRSGADGGAPRQPLRCSSESNGGIRAVSGRTVRSRIGAGTQGSFRSCSLDGCRGIG